MDFLAPLFAAVGVAAAAVPVVLHMLRRAPTQNMPFSIVRFLKPSRPKLTKRSTVEHWPLLLLRILALVLLGLAFSRPFQRAAVTAESDNASVQHVALLIDRSASMRRDGLRDNVIRTVREAVEDLSDEDLLSVLEFSKDTSTIISVDQWAKATSGEREAMLSAVLDNYQPDWMQTNTGMALRQAADELAQENRPGSAVKQRRLILITDFQEGSELDALKNSSWPASVQLDLRTVKPTQPGNVGISWFKDRRTDRIRVRLTSAGDTSRTHFELQPFDETGVPTGKTISVKITPGQRTTVLLPKADEATARVIARVELKDDPHSFDNIIDLPTTQNPMIKVAHIGPSSPNDPETMRYYLQRALDGVTDQRVELVDVIRDDGVVLPIAADVRLAVATSAVPESLHKSLRNLLERGGVLLAAMHSTEMAGSLATFLPRELHVSEAEVSDYAMLGQIDFESPMFAAFSDAKFSDFSSIRFWRYRQLSLPMEDRKPGEWNVAAKFDSGDPAIVSAASNSGRIILLASGWQPDDSQWALSTRFPPMISSVLAMADPGRSDELVRTVGDTVHPGELVLSTDWTMQLPDGNSMNADNLRMRETSSPTTTESQTAQRDSRQPGTAFELTAPGRYVIAGRPDDAAQDSKPATVTLLAGLAPAESRTEALPAGQLQVLGVTADNLETDIDSQTQSGDNAKPGQLNASELESRQKLWRWFLLAGLACLVLESLLASVIEGRSPKEGLL